MRVTSDTLRQVFLSALQLAQRRVVDTQTQVSTGLRVNRPSDAPLDSARIRTLEASLARLDQYQANGVIARNRLGLEEAAIADAINHLQRIRELVVQAANATQNPENRAATALEVRERLDGLIALANTADASGRYLFSGYSETTRPFASGASGVVYNGDQGQRRLQISDGRLVAVSDSGAEVFQRIPDGNGTFSIAANPANVGTGVLGAGSLVDPALYVADTYTVTFLNPTDYEVRDSGGGLVSTGTYSAGQSITFLGIQIELDGAPGAGDSFTATPSTSQDLFATVANVIAALETASSGPAARAQTHNQLGQSLEDIDQAVDHLLGIRTDIGSRLRALEGESALNEGFTIQLTDTLSELRDLDYPEALSLLSQQLIGLEAAQQTYARVQGLSLFRFL